jgi:hypothetical protein
MDENIFKTDQEPYYDDFDSSKSFMSILFVPGRPVQVRELNQLQTILHHQQKMMGDHIFKHGSIVNGQSVTRVDTHYLTVEKELYNFDPNTHYKATADGFEFTKELLTDSLGKQQYVDLTKIGSNYTIEGVQTKVKAKIISVLQRNDTEPDTIYFNVIDMGQDVNTDSSFAEGELLVVKNSQNFIVMTLKGRIPPPESIPFKGTGTLWTIPDAIYYVHGYFVEISNMTIVGEKYYTNQTPFYKIILKVNLDKVTSEHDPSLFDNTLGYPNYGATGADRARILLEPRTVLTEPTYDFITLVTVQKGVVVFLKNKTEYAAIMDMIAERTYDESGNYVSKRFETKFIEHLNRNNNGGMFTEKEGGDNSKFVVQITTGRAYVKGYQVDKIAGAMINVEKARDTRVRRNFFTQTGTLSYILIKPSAESWVMPAQHDQDSVFGNFKAELHDGPVEDGHHTGIDIGYIRPFDAELHEEDEDGTKIYKLYFSAIEMLDGKKFNECKSVSFYGSINFVADVMIDELTSQPTVYNNLDTALLWTLRKDVKTTRDADNPKIRSLSYSCKERFVCVLDGQGTYKFDAPKNTYFENYNIRETICGLTTNASGNGQTQVFKPELGEVEISPQEIKIDLGPANGGKTFIMIHGVMKSQVQEKTKTLLTITETITPYDTKYLRLSKSDLWEVISITRETAESGIEYTPEKTDNGQRDFAYVNSVITLKTEDVGNMVNAEFNVTYSYFEHSEGEFFSIDSYRNVIDDRSNGIYREDIKSYSTKGGKVVRLLDCLDFRPLVLHSDDPDAKIKMEQPRLNGTVVTDIEYYLPRTDYIVVNKEGVIFQLKGIADEKPVPPKIADDGSEMALYELIQQPYVYSVNKDVGKRLKENKRYRMEDIARLKKRLDNVEYYTTLSLMELTLAETSVKDQYGMDRFKNGFLADNFANFQASDPGANEFRAAIDATNKKLIPSYETFKIDFDVDKNLCQNLKFYDDKLAILDYTPELFISQPSATKHVSVNPYLIFNKEGSILFEPQYDNHKEESMLPPHLAELQLEASERTLDVTPWNEMDDPDLWWNKGYNP